MPVCKVKSAVTAGIFWKSYYGIYFEEEKSWKYLKNIILSRFIVPSTV